MIYYNVAQWTILGQCWPSLVCRLVAMIYFNCQGQVLHRKNHICTQLVQIMSARRQWQPTPVLLPGKSHGRRSLVGCSPWGREESDVTEWLHFHFSLLCTGEGNGNPLQCSCLENPRDGVAQSQTWLKWLSSSSNLLCGPTLTSIHDYWKKP